MVFPLYFWNMSGYMKGVFEGSKHALNLARLQCKGAHLTMTPKSLPHSQGTVLHKRRLCEMPCFSKSEHIHCLAWVQL